VPLPQDAPDAERSRRDCSRCPHPCRAEGRGQGNADVCRAKWQRAVIPAARSGRSAWSRPSAAVDSQHRLSFARGERLAGDRGPHLNGIVGRAHHSSQVIIRTFLRLTVPAAASVMSSRGLRPVSRVPLPRSARSHSPSRRRGTRDRLSTTKRQHRPSAGPAPEKQRSSGRLGGARLLRAESGHAGPCRTRGRGCPIWAAWSRAGEVEIVTASLRRRKRVRRAVGRFVLAATWHFG
jgi:hypothetical protein